MCLGRKGVREEKLRVDGVGEGGGTTGGAKLGVVVRLVKTWRPWPQGGASGV